MKTSHTRNRWEIAKERTVALKGEILSKAVEKDGRKVVVLDKPIDMNMLRNAAFMLQKEASNLVVLAAFEVDGKPQLLLMYSADLVAAGKNAQNDIKEASRFIQGGGGGQPGLATAGGKNAAGIPEAKAKLLEKIAG